MSFKVVTWNVNGIRSRIEDLLMLLNQENPDILLLQETKCEDKNFPFEGLEHTQYNISICGQPSYNGVAILSKFKIESSSNTFPNNPCPEQMRFLEICCNTEIGYTRILSTYFPNGGEVGGNKFDTKLAFYDAIYEYLISCSNTDNENIIIGGDFNAAPFDIDVHSPEDLRDSLCFTMVEKRKLRRILNSGFHDLYRIQNPNEREFSWWDYRERGFEKNRGFRIDFILANSRATNNLLECKILKQYRQSHKPSDHAPVAATFSMISETLRMIS